MRCDVVALLMGVVHRARNGGVKKVRPNIPRSTTAIGGNSTCCYSLTGLTMRMRSSLGPPTQKRGALAAAVAEIAEITLFKMAASPFTSAMLLALVGPAVLASTGSMCAAMGKRRIVGLNAMPGGMSLRLEKCPWCEMHRDNRFGGHRSPQEDTKLLVAGGEFAGNSPDFVRGVRGHSREFGGIRWNSLLCAGTRGYVFLGVRVPCRVLKTSRADPF